MSSASHVDVKDSNDVAALGLAAAARAIKDSQLSVDAYITACLRRVAARDDRLRAFAQFQGEYASRRAYVFDRMPADKRGPMHGIPVSVAEVIDIKDMRCARGSSLYADRVAASDAALIGQARTAGAIVLGSTASAEFGCFGPGPSRNPHADDRSPGGSGGAAAVAAGMVPLAFDVRPDGAISRPASFCGVYGLKATRGAIAAEGMTSLAPSLEGIGFYMRDAADVGVVGRVLLGRRAIPDFRDARTRMIDGLTVRILDSPSGYRIQPASRSAINRAVMALSDKRIDAARFRLPPHFVKAEICYETRFSYELSQNLARDRDRVPDLMTEETRARIDQGRRIDAGTYEQARRDAIAMRSELLDYLTGETVFLDAGVEDVAPRYGNDSGWSPLQALWAIAGVPVLCVPCGTVDGLPVGVQIVAAPGREDLLARVGCIIEDRIEM